jgi:glucose-1-phosphate adenylyltransferase
MNLTDRQAKPAVPFAGKFRIIDFPLSNSVNSGIRRISVVTQYKAHELIRHVQAGWGFMRAELGEFVELWPAQQQTEAQTWYLGTANSVYQNLEALRAHAPRYVLILAGDHVYRQDYSKMLAQHIREDADLTVACIDVPIETAGAFGVVGTDDQRCIVSFVEKPERPPAIPGQPGRAYASMGIYLFNAECLYDALERNAGVEGTAHDFGKDVLPDLVTRRQGKIIAHGFEDSCILTGLQREPYWRDVGTLDAYWEANLDLISVTPALDLYDRSWPIWTYQVQRPPAKFVFDDDTRRGMALDSMVSAGCIISGATLRRSLLCTDAVAHSYSVIEDSVVLPRSHVGRRARLRKVIVDQDCQIPADLVVGEDPEADIRRFHRTVGGVTLVTAEMLARL